MFEYYVVRFKFTTAPLQLHYGMYSMLLNTVGHKIDGNCVSWKYMGQKTTRAVLPHVGFFGAVQIMLIFFLQIAYFPETTVSTLIEDIFLYNTILWDLCYREPIISKKPISLRGAVMPQPFYFPVRLG